MRLLATSTLAKILRTQHNIADCRTEQERSSGEGGRWVCDKKSRVGGSAGGILQQKIQGQRFPQILFFKSSFRAQCSA